VHFCWFLEKGQSYGWINLGKNEINLKYFYFIKFQTISIVGATIFVATSKVSLLLHFIEDKKWYGDFMTFGVTLAMGTMFSVTIFQFIPESLHFLHVQVIRESKQWSWTFLDVQCFLRKLPQRSMGWKHRRPPQLPRHLHAETFRLVRHVQNRRRRCNVFYEHDDGLLLFLDPRLWHPKGGDYFLFGEKRSKINCKLSLLEKN